MHTRNTRSIEEGIGFGIVAGIMLMAVNVSASLAVGAGALWPFRMAASVLLGSPALDAGQVYDGNALAVGLGVHLALSAFFGFVYALAMTWRSHETRTSWAAQTGIGLVYGLLIWFADFQVIGRAMYPWFLDFDQVSQSLMHAGFFGLPLGLLYATAERRADVVEPTYQVH